MKLGGSTASAQPETPTPDTAPAGPDDTNLDFGNPDQAVAPEANDKPFDDQPFDAGVEADEQSDPKKFIEQLTGKLGQSLRKYEEEQGQPDFELEKFAINSVLAASHTSEMDPKDQGDIIKKVKSAGNNDDAEVPEETPTDDQPEIPTDDEDNTFEELPTSESLNEMGLGDSRVQVLLDIYDKGSDSVKKILTRLVSFSGKPDRNIFIRDVQEDVDQNDMDYIFDKIKEIGIPIPAKVAEGEEFLLKNPKKNNMFQKGSNDKLKEITEEKLQNREKKSIFVKNQLKLVESFNDMSQPTVEPTIKPTVKPKTNPVVKPNRRNKPFLPNVTPDVRPDPKAAVDEEIPMAKPKRKKTTVTYPVYHDSFSSAVQAAREFAASKGYIITDEEWMYQVSTGPRKPIDGKTNRYSLELWKNGELQKKQLHIQVYGMANQYELNTYIS